MLCYLIRHGQTDWNMQRRFQGRQDIALNEAGREQAQRIAARFAGTRLHRIYHSPLSRAAQTALLLAERSPAPLCCVPELAEICMGEWEGLSFDQVKAQSPAAYARYMADRRHAAPPGGESFEALQRRALAAMQPLLARETGDFAVVAHGAIFKALLCAYLHVDLENLNAFDVSNGSVSVVDFQNDRVKVITLNDLSHFPHPYDSLAGNQAVL